MAWTRGPNVRRLGVYDKVWTDHSDIRPTILAFAGLGDDYSHQGRPITEVMSGNTEGRSHGDNINRLAAIYKQINAPVGQLDEVHAAAAA